MARIQCERSHEGRDGEEETVVFIWIVPSC
jgi:hypothetical protein